MTGDGSDKRKWRKDQPLTVKKKTWDADAETTQLKLNARTGASVQFTDSFYILRGNEIPELYLQFCMNFRERIWNNLTLDHATKRELLLKMCTGAAKQAVRDVLARTDLVYTMYADRNQYTWNSPLIKHWHTRMLERGNDASLWTSICILE